MKKTRDLTKSAAPRRPRRPQAGSQTGPEPGRAGDPAARPESLAFWQQLKTVGGDVALRYRRD